MVLVLTTGYEYYKLRLKDSMFTFSTQSQRAYLILAKSWSRGDVVLLLGKLHKKFRLSRGMLPRVQDVMEYVNKLRNKLQWQWLSRGVNPVRVFHVSRSDLAPSLPPPSIDVAPELRCWSNFFTWQIRRACARPLSKHSYNKQCWCNRTPLDTVAMACLRDSQ